MLKTRTSVGFIIAMLLAASWRLVIAAAGDTEKVWDASFAPPEVPTSISAAMQDRNYAAAIASIEQELPKSTIADYLTFLHGRALELAGKPDDAVATFRSVEEKYPKSVWRQHARFAAGLCLARKGDFRAAEEIYGSGAKQLLSAERKKELAAVYADYAQRYFQPPQRDAQPEYQKAFDFFTRALEIGPEPERKIEIELRIAECLAKLNRVPEAIAKYTQFSKDHADHTFDIEARYLLGECQLPQNARDARRTWQDLLAKYPDSKSPRIREAAFRLAETHGFPQPNSDEELVQGTTELEAFIARFAEHESATTAYLNIARAKMHRSRFAAAAKTLADFVKDAKYAKRTDRAEALFLLGRCQQVQKEFETAIGTWRDYLREYPSDHHWNDAQQGIIETEFLIAKEAFTQHKWEDARTKYANFLTKYPLDSRAAAIHFDLGQSFAEEKEWEDAISAWRNLVSKYPSTDPASAGQFAIAHTLEVEQHDYEAAIKEFDKVTWGSHMALAKSRRTALTAAELQIATERVVRSDETPTVKLHTRNVESVAVKAYEVDLETYFRKMHLGNGVEGLDIALIDPDKQFDFAIPKFVKYERSEQQLELAMPRTVKQGVLAVTVSSKTHEATTLVIQSDLDITVKSSRDEVFVFAQNSRTNKPWPNARLLISNGGKIFAEGTTDQDGVFRKSCEELKTANDLRVFAIAEGHVASNVVGLQGVGVAQGLTDRGYIVTDRAAYRPGQLVHLHGVIRSVDHDAFVITPGRKYRVDINLPSQQVLTSCEVSLSEWGSFATHITLPESTPPGTYTINLTDDEQHHYQGNFLVQEFSLEPVRLTVDTPRTVYYRGEEIVGKIKAEYQYGAPLANREIQYQLAGDRLYTARTNADGIVEFRLPTREFFDAQHLPLTVRLAERNLEIQKDFLLAVQGFSIQVNLPRSVYLAGESFEVTASVTSAEGKPLGEAVDLEVFEQTSVNGVSGERLVTTQSLKTDTKSGKVRQAIKLEGGGNFLVRASGTDEFHNRVCGQTVVQISDKSDKVRLRILADQFTYKVGDEARCTIHWREKPALALITYQGTTILHYELRELATGENEVKIPLLANLAPNFEVAVTVMSDHVAPLENGTPGERFHQANVAFDVERELNIKLATKQGSAERPGQPPAPGDPLEVTVTTTDAQGKPIAAEVSLAMIEQALVDRFGSGNSIRNLFTGLRRQSAFRTTSSIVFGYHPRTMPIDRQLLAEADREAVAAAEAAALAATVNAPGIETMVEQPAAPMMEALSGHENEKDEMKLSDDSDNFSYYSAGTVLLQPKSLSRRLAGGTGREMGEKNKSRSSATGYGLSDQPNDTKQRQIADLARKERGLLYLNRSVVALQADGIQINHTFAGRSIPQAKLLEFQAKGIILMPAMVQTETGYWNPSLVTDEHGTATVQFDLPDQSTAWKFIARGVTKETLTGEAEAELVVKKPLFGELKLPLAFVSGDQGEVVATIHHQGAGALSVKVTLTATQGEKSSTETKTVDFKAPGDIEVTFPLTILPPVIQDKHEPAKDGDKAVDRGIVTCELTVTSGEQNDLLTRAVPILPSGVSVYGTASGAATSDSTAFVEFPGDMPVEGASLRIQLGGTMERSLLDVLEGPISPCSSYVLRLASSSDVLTSDLLAALGLEKLFASGKQAELPHAAGVEQRIRSAVSGLVASQREDGGWAWTDKRASSDRGATARAVWALALAQRASHLPQAEPLEKGVRYLQSQLAATGDTDYEIKAVLLQALAASGQGDFALANRLYRERPALSASALVHLALALAEMDRASLAQEVLDLVAKQNLDAPPTPNSPPTTLPTTGGVAELRALWALAQQRVNPGHAKNRELVDWLLEHRVAHRWAPDRATGPATLALCHWQAENKRRDERYTLNVFVNDLKAATLEIDNPYAAHTIDVPAHMLAKGKQRVQFQMTGRGHFAYECVLSGSVPADKIKSTTNDWQVTRTYQPGPLEVDGQEIPRGFGICHSFNAFENPLTQLPVAKRGQVRLNCWRGTFRPDDSRLEYLVITEPIPSGCAVVESSIRGGFERFEIQAGSITFYVGGRRHIEPIEYDLVGYLPGNYHAAPTQVRNAYRPDQFAVAPAKELRVLALGEKSADAYRLTPQELFELGKREAQRHNYAAAAGHLEDLFTHWNLQHDPYKETAKMLLECNLALDQPPQIVRYFEIIKEKWADLEISHEDILRIGTAYHKLGEYERAYLVYRATVESSFEQESNLPGFLETQGEFVKSVSLMQRLQSEYPPEPYNAAASYALAQRIYSKAPQAASDPHLREKQINRVTLIRKGLAGLDGFLTAHPDDPAADQAAFATATALLDLKAYKAAMASCRKYAERYPKSDYLDSYWYVVGFGHFALGEHQDAIEMCRKVSTAKHIDKTSGKEVESNSKWQAIYILGQVYHSLNKAAEAIQYYAQVESRFADAKEAIAYFTRQDLSLPEVTTLEPGKPGKVELVFRNVAECDMKVYRIDLVKFGLLRRNLASVSKINLAGIHPLHEEVVKLGDGKDYRDRSRTLDLPLKEEGAYLVVGRSADLHASGLVLVTPLVVEVNEEVASGRVRATVRDVVANKYLSDAAVKVIGSRNQDFIAGQTDLRGVFIADGVQGRSTVLAQGPHGKYAFYRGTQELGPPPAPAAAPPKAPASTSIDSDGGNEQLIKQLRDLNGANQSIQNSQMDKLFRNDNRGNLRAKSAY
jgi:TolA-binding protein